MNDLGNARIQEIRYQLLCLLDSDRPNFIGEELLIRSLKVDASQEDVRRELHYLKQRDLVEIRKNGDRVMASLVASGVDLLEGNTVLPGVLILDGRLSHLELERRKNIRWVVLRLSDRSRPIPLSESLAQRALHDVSYVVSQGELRRIITYLEQKKLLQIERSKADSWSFTPTADGVDCCEYNADCPPGVGRPEQYR